MATKQPSGKNMNLTENPKKSPRGDKSPRGGNRLMESQGGSGSGALSVSSQSNVDLKQLAKDSVRRRPRGPARSSHLPFQDHDRASFAPCAASVIAVSLPPA